MNSDGCDRVPPAGISRRTFLRWSAAAAAAPALSLPPTSADRARDAATGAAVSEVAGFPVEEATIADLQEQMTAGRFTSALLVRSYLERVEELDRGGPQLRSILEINPDAEAVAAALDEERRGRGARGPLHGIPILLKDNIDTADRTTTTAGSLALEGSIPPRDATVAERLRRAGAVLLGKANMSEWANFRSSHSSSGWSSRGGQCSNPYALDRSPCGSSSGSAVAVAANLVAAALGTETDGSVVCPASATGLVGIKTTLGLVSRAGVVPIAHSQDTVGPMARTVADAAVLLGALTGVDPRDPATSVSAGRFQRDYTKFLDPDGLRGARIGVAREVFFGYSEETDTIVNEAIETLRRLGATIVDPADIPTAKELASGTEELEILEYEFKTDLDAYLAALGRGAPVGSLADVIAFNERNAERVMPWFGQDLLIASQAKGPLTEPAYRKALATSRRLSRTRGMDASLARFRVDALVAPTGSPAFKIDLLNGDHFLGGSSTPAAMAGYPALTVPCGDVRGLPVGITFMGPAYSEPVLIRLAYAFEQATHARRAPRYPASVDPQAQPGTTSRDITARAVARRRTSG
jgi:amidase